MDSNNKGSAEQRLSNYLEAVDAMVTLLGETGLTDHQVVFLDSVKSSLSQARELWKGICNSHQSDSRPSTPKVLVVDDDPVQRIFNQKILERSGFTVSVAKDGLEAVELAKGERFALILMDCQMPGFDGFQATEKIRENEKGTGIRVPIVALTAHALPGYKQLCLKTGMDDYAKKPLATKDLIGLVKKYSP